MKRILELIKNSFKRYYSVNVISKEGKLIGCQVASVWFWISPIQVHSGMNKISNGAYYFVDFKRVK